MTAVDSSFADIAHRHLIRMQQPETAKNVHVYLNGDKHFTGRKLVVNRRYISDFDGFLNQVTLSLKAPFGAVRNIYTPSGGHRVSDLAQLRGGMHLVASGVDRFRKIDYNEIGAKRRQHQPRNPLGTRLNRSKITVPARWRKYVGDPCQIFVYGNGDLNSPALRILIIPRIMKSWDLVLNEITEKIAHRTGQAARKLYDINFNLLHEPSQLVNGSYYVVVGNEKLKKYPYGELHSKSPSQHKSLQPLPPIKRKPKPPARDQENNSYIKMYVQKKQQKVEYEETTVMGASAATGYRTLKFRKPKTTKTSTDELEEETVFPPPKAMKVKRASGASVTVKHELPPVSDENDGVFRKETREIKAETVDDDDDIKVDLPIDQVPANEIVDEDLSNEAKQEAVDDEDEAISLHSDDVIEDRPKSNRSDRVVNEIDEIPILTSGITDETKSNGNMTDRSEQEKSVEFEEAASPLEVNRTPSREKVDAEDKLESSSTPEAEIPDEIEENIDEEKADVDEDTFVKTTPDPKTPIEDEIDEKEMEVNAADLLDQDKVDSPVKEDSKEESRPETGGVEDEVKSVEENVEDEREKSVNNELLDDDVTQNNEDVNDDKKVEETPIASPDIEALPSNRSVTPSSPEPRIEAEPTAPAEDDPDLNSVPDDTENNRASSGVAASEQVEDDQSLPSPQPVQDSLDASQQNGEVPARPASDALTVDEEPTAPLTSSSKKSVPNGDVAGSTEVS